MNPTLISLIGGLGMASVFVVFVNTFSNMTNRK